MTTKSGRAPELEEAPWRTSSYSQNAGGECVEVADLSDQDGTVLIRDSKDKSGPVLTMTSQDWTALISFVGSGEADFGVL